VSSERTGDARAAADADAQQAVRAAAARVGLGLRARARRRARAQQRPRVRRAARARLAQPRDGRAGGAQVHVQPAAAAVRRGLAQQVVQVLVVHLCSLRMTDGLVLGLIWLCLRARVGQRLLVRLCKAVTVT